MAPLDQSSRSRPLGLVPGTDPYPWPWDGSVVPERLALIICGADTSWRARTTEPAAVAAAGFAVILQDCRVHKDNLLGDPEVRTDKGFGGVMQTFDNTRPLVAAMALGVARAALDETRTLLEDNGFHIDYDTPAAYQPGAVQEFIELEAYWEAAKLLTMQAAWMADNRKPNSLQASMAKAKAGRSGQAPPLGR